MSWVRLLVCAFLAANVHGFVARAPTAAQVRRVVGRQTFQVALEQSQPPPVPPPTTTPIGPRSTQPPDFRWGRVLFFAANPFAFLPIAALGAFAFHLPLFHFPSLWSAGAAGRVAALATLLLSVLHVLERYIPALAEVSRASRTITLYAMGARLVPLRALCASATISASAAFAEEVAFRGVLQTGLQRLLVLLHCGAPAATVLSIIGQALVFGKLHSYTSSSAYWIVASCVGLVFGGASVGHDRAASLPIPTRPHCQPHTLT